MTPNQQQVQQYIQTVMSKLDSEPDKLTKEERRLGQKYKAEMSRMNQLNADIGQFRDQIRQAEARLRSLELQLADTQGKANAYLDYLAITKFDIDEMPGMAPSGEIPAKIPSRTPEVVKDAGKNKKKAEAVQPHA